MIKCVPGESVSVEWYYDWERRQKVCQKCALDTSAIGIIFTSSKLNLVEIVEFFIFIDQQALF